MTTSGRGPAPPYNEYQDYGKSRRKLYPAPEPPSNGRDFSSAPDHSFDRPRPAGYGSFTSHQNGVVNGGGQDGWTRHYHPSRIQNGTSAVPRNGRKYSNVDRYQSMDNPLVSPVSEGTNNGGSHIAENVNQGESVLHAIEEPKQNGTINKNYLSPEDSLSMEVAYSTVYPMTKIETQYQQLVAEYNRSPTLPYTPQHVITSLSDYPCYQRNIDVFSEKHPRLLKMLQVKHHKLSRHRVELVREYQQLGDQWQKEREWMDQQLQLLYPPDDETRKEIDADVRKPMSMASSDVEIPHEQLPSKSRRSRGRRGDLVSSEAEFQEILQRLGNEQDEDPVARAERYAASIPDLILDPVERYQMKYMDNNNVIRDKEGWAHRVKTDFIDNFSTTEHQLFCNAWCLFPKKFGAISRHLGGLRTASDCVVHYYATKKDVNYKQLLVQYKKKVANARKSRKAKSKRSTTEEGSPETEEDSNKRKRSSSSVESSKKKRKKEEVEPVTVAAEVKPPASGVTATQVISTTNDVPVHIPPPVEDAVDKKRVLSSYWSITEMSAFPELLHKHGSDWEKIAEELSTKSAVMVRNYFLRNAVKYNWTSVVETTDNKSKVKEEQPVGKVNINSLLADASPVKPEPVVTVQPIRSSIINLLNAEADSKVVVQPHHSNKLSDLLNSSPAPPPPPPLVLPPPPQPSKHKLADLLSAEP